jgi:serine/threonine protein phosphatase PrpC
MQRPTKRGLSSKQEIDLGYAREEDSKSKRRARSSKILWHVFQMSVSESTRRIMWLGTLVIIFVMERRRTWIRSSLNLNETTVLTGIMIETSEDGTRISDRRLDKFTEITTGSVPFQDTKACNDLMKSNNKCIQFYPFVDLREFRKQNPHKRLKQAMQIPDNYSSGLLTQRGVGVSHEDGNQDRAILLSPFHPFSRPGLSTDFLSAVFDGHGQYGHYISQAAMESLPTFLAIELNLALQTKAEIHEVITEVFIQTFRKIDKYVPDIDLSGTTATVVLKLGQHLHIANVGDSRTFVVLYHTEKETTKLFYSTTPDTLDVPVERERILGMGGSIYLPPTGPRGVQPPPRVYVTIINPVTNETESFALENSRSIGDRAVKDSGVVCEPKVASLNLQSLWQNHPGEEVFVFSTTDGLLDKMAVQSVADRLAGGLYRQDTVSPLETIEGIILDVNEIWEHSRILNEKNELMNYRDDMTLAVMKVQRET